MQRLVLFVIIVIKVEVMIKSFYFLKSESIDFPFGKSRCVLASCLNKLPFHFSPSRAGLTNYFDQYIDLHET